MPVRPKKTKGQRWSGISLPFYGEIALGNGTQWAFHIAAVNNGPLLVTIMGKGGYGFGSFAHPDYVGEKLGLPLQFNDRMNVADLINELLKIEAQEFGQYYEDLCE